MTEWSHDGHPIQVGTTRADYALTGQRAHFSILDIREMVVVARYYVDDQNNRSKRFVEYACRDLYTSEIYPNCRQVSQMGGVDDGDDNTLRPSTSFLPGATGVTGAVIGEQTPAMSVDGDQVLVGFISGSRSRPVIIGVFRHSGSQYGATSEQGERRLTRHKGTTVEIRSDGTWVLTQASGSTVTLDPDGSVVARGKDGASVALEVGGGVTVAAAAGKQVSIGDGTPLVPIMGAINGQAIDPFTGATQFALGNASLTVLIKK